MRFVKYVFWWGMLWLPLSAMAEGLIHFQSGRASSTQELLGIGKLLLYVEEDCRPCRQYLEDLQKCSASVLDKVVVVSTSTPAQTKKMIPLFPKRMDVYIFKDKKGLKSISATPTTQSRQGKIRGILSCHELMTIGST